MINQVYIHIYKPVTYIIMVRIVTGRIGPQFHPAWPVRSGTVSARMQSVQEEPSVLSFDFVKCDPSLDRPIWSSKLPIKNLDQPSPGPGPRTNCKKNLKKKILNIGGFNIMLHGLLQMNGPDDLDAWSQRFRWFWQFVTIWLLRSNRPDHLTVQIQRSKLFFWKSSNFFFSYFFYLYFFPL